jgi:hypothetical protein
MADYPGPVKEVFPGGGKPPEEAGESGRYRGPVLAALGGLFHILLLGATAEAFQKLQFLEKQPLNSVKSRL